MQSRLWLSTAVLGVLTLTSGCSKDSGGSGGGSPSPTVASPASPVENFDRRLSAPLPQLSESDVSSALAADRTKPLTIAERAQLATSLRATAGSAAVSATVRARLTQFVALADAQKPVFLLLGAEDSTDAAQAALAPAIVISLQSPAENVRITALAVLARHAALVADAAVETALEALATNPSNLSFTQRHWLAVALGAQLAATPSTGTPAPWLERALGDASLDFATLARGTAPAVVKGIVDRHATDFSAQRLALAADWLKSQKGTP